MSIVPMAPKPRAWQHQLKAFGMLFTEFVRARPNEWDAIMTYRYRKEHNESEAYSREILRLFGLMQTATEQFYGEHEQEEHAADMAVLWSSLTGILGVASSERRVGGLSLDQMLEQLIGMYLEGAVIIAGLVFLPRAIKPSQSTQGLILRP